MIQQAIVDPGKTVTFLKDNKNIWNCKKPKAQNNNNNNNNNNNTALPCDRNEYMKGFG